MAAGKDGKSAYSIDEDAKEGMKGTAAPRTRRRVVRILLGKGMYPEVTGLWDIYSDVVTFAAEKWQMELIMPFKGSPTAWALSRKFCIAAHGEWVWLGVVTMQRPPVVYIPRAKGLLPIRFAEIPVQYGVHTTPHALEHSDGEPTQVCDLESTSSGSRSASELSTASAWPDYNFTHTWTWLA